MVNMNMNIILCIEINEITKTSIVQVLTLSITFNTNRKTKQ